MPLVLTIGKLVVANLLAILMDGRNGVCASGSFYVEDVTAKKQRIIKPKNLHIHGALILNGTKVNLRDGLSPLKFNQGY